LIVSQRYGHPAGISVGRALRIQTGILNDDLRYAVAAIDKVHGVGDLPSVPMRIVPYLPDHRGRRRDGVFVYRRADPSLPFMASIILIRSDAPHGQLVAIHEIGHYLDLCGLPGPGFSSADDPALAEWRQAVMDSRAYHELEALTGSPRAGVADRAYDLTVLEELWARSYAQFVATRSGSVQMQRAVAALRCRTPPGLYYPRQWDDDDFAAIEAAMDALFRGLGWIA
jgi:hypothetical protein